MGIYQAFAVTVTGISHTKQDKNCQDYSCKGDHRSGIAIAAVADGHGDDNCFRSDRGAQFAVDCAVKGISEFIKINRSKFSLFPLLKKANLAQNEWDNAVRNLIKYIIASWHDMVVKDYSTNAFTQKELSLIDEKHRIRYKELDDVNHTSYISKAYGTTLIASAITPHYWLSIHIGDGRLNAFYSDGAFEQPVPWDEKCFLNATTSLCDEDSFERARHYFSLASEKPLPVAVFLCTDGIDDNYPVEGNENHLRKLYRTIALAFAEDGFEKTVIQLNDLANQFATKGKGDDTSIAGFIDMIALKKAVPNWQKEIVDEEETTEDEEGTIEIEKAATIEVLENAQTAAKIEQEEKLEASNVQAAIEAFAKQSIPAKPGFLRDSYFGPENLPAGQAKINKDDEQK